MRFGGGWVPHGCVNCVYVVRCCCDVGCIFVCFCGVCGCIWGVFEVYLCVFDVFVWCICVYWECFAVFLFVF